MSSSYYIYFLKDPRTKPSKVFYIGKGVSSETWKQDTEIDSTRKGQYVEEIIGSGESVIMGTMYDELTEKEASHYLSVVISGFGTIEEGGQLLNE